MEFKWYLIKAKVEDHAYLPRMISNIEFTYALHEETESNKFLVKDQVVIPLKRPESTKNYVPYAETMDFEQTVYKWGMDRLLAEENEDEVILEEKKMKRILYDMMNRKNLEKGATIIEETVWGYGLEGESGILKSPDIDPEATKLPFLD